MKRYIVEVTRTGYREIEAEDCNSAEEIADMKQKKAKVLFVDVMYQR